MEIVNTLGYSDDERLSRSDIASVQVVTAIELFVAEQFIPNITLGGVLAPVARECVEGSGWTGLVFIASTRQKVRPE